jgi:RNA polymerase sigma-70 factor (ECF subfamily)
VTPTDEQLVTAAATGDLAAYDTLMERYERLLFKVAHGFTGSRDGALDLVQATFLRTFRQLRQFRAESSFKTWLLRILFNEGSRWQRENRRRGDRTAPLEAAALQPAPGPDPEQKSLEGERRHQLLRGLGTLNRRHAHAVILRYFEGRQIPDIAATLDCTEGTVRNMLFRALRRLHCELADVSR